jgi:hypothetical protein
MAALMTRRSLLGLMISPFYPISSPLVRYGAGYAPVAPTGAKVRNPPEPFHMPRVRQPFQPHDRIDTRHENLQGPGPVRTGNNGYATRIPIQKKDPGVARVPRGKKNLPSSPGRPGRRRVPNPPGGSPTSRCLHAAACRRLASRRGRASARALRGFRRSRGRHRRCECR